MFYACSVDKWKKELDEHFSLLHSTLEARKKELLAELVEQVERKTAVLTTQARLTVICMSPGCIQVL